MRILLIDNGTKNIGKFHHYLTGNTVVVVENDNLDSSFVPEFHAVILSGGSRFPIIGNEDKLSHQIALIQSAQVPVLGVCFGAELIAHVYGASLYRLEQKVRGSVCIKPLIFDSIFQEIDALTVSESHQWSITALKLPLRILAQSETGIEIFRHEERQLYGVQFHPELQDSKSSEGNILVNFLTLARKYTQETSIL